MRAVRQTFLAFIINGLFPVIMLDACLSGFYWSFSPTLGLIACVIDSAAALAVLTSSVALGGLLRRSRTPTSPYVYKNGPHWGMGRPYFGIEQTDRRAFSLLMTAVRQHQTMKPLFLWLRMNDVAWVVLVAGFAPVVLAILLVGLVQYWITKKRVQFSRFHSV